MTSRAEPRHEAGTRTYYGQPILKEPAWTVEVPWYLFAGGLAGASSLVAIAADAVGDRGLARAAARAAGTGAVVSPVLLILDLGRPARFVNMLRMFKVTSPLSVGSWVLAAYGPSAVATAVLGELGRSPRLRRLASFGAGTTGSVLSVYTGVLLADTAIPVWHHARRELPFVFAASSAASAGAAAALLGDGSGRVSPRARRLAVAGVASEMAGVELMKHRLGRAGRPYREGVSGRWANAAEVLNVVGGIGLVVARRSPAVARLAATAVLAGSVCQRFAVFRAGFASANDAEAIVELQRAGSSPGER